MRLRAGHRSDEKIRKPLLRLHQGIQSSRTFTKEQKLLRKDRHLVARVYLSGTFYGKVVFSQEGFRERDGEHNLRLGVAHQKGNNRNGSLETEHFHPEKQAGVVFSQELSLRDDRWEFKFYKKPALLLSYREALRTRSHGWGVF